MDNKEPTYDLGYLFLKSLDGSITEAQFRQLQAHLLKSPSARDYYLRYVATYSLLQQVDVTYSAGPHESPAELAYDEEMWDMLARAEKEAPVVQVPQTEDDRPPACVRPVSVPQPSRKLTTTSVVSLIVSAAALVFFVVLAHLEPGMAGDDVATVTGSIDAQWDESYTDLKIGHRLRSKSPALWLKSGFAELTFDNGSRVTFEAPAAFEIVADDQIKLNYGRLYAAVPTQALGFTVTTPHSKIIDLGTEFGVRADLNNQTQLHVIKGRTMLISGPRQDGRETCSVTQGQAKAIDSARGVRDIPVQTDAFVRRIDSDSRFIWKGQDRVDLADIVGGGNGFGTGRLNAGIDYTGQTTVLTTRTSEEGPRAYVPVPSNPFVDGVFIPNGSTQVTGDGTRHVFEPTNGRYWLGVLNGAWHQIELTVDVPRHALRLGGITYGTAEHPAIYMSANQAVTFDLQAIRRFTRMDLTRFTAACGVSESYGDYWEIMRQNKAFTEAPQATFQVLVDGVPRVLIENITYRDRAAAIDVPLSPQDRFLTLATTQGRDGSNNGDWTLFAEPSLVLQPK